jgi:hypothetical protein
VGDGAMVDVGIGVGGGSITGSESGALENATKSPLSQPFGGGTDKPAAFDMRPRTLIRVPLFSFVTTG